MDTDRRYKTPGSEKKISLSLIANNSSYKTSIYAGLPSPDSHREMQRGLYDACTSNGWHYKKGTPSTGNVNLGNGQ